jgi:hypothetical protein
MEIREIDESAAAMVPVSFGLERDSTGPMEGMGATAPDRWGRCADGDGIVHAGDRERVYSSVFPQVTPVSVTTRTPGAATLDSDSTGCGVTPRTGGERSAAGSKDSRPHGWRRFSLRSLSQSSDMSDVGSEGSQARMSQVLKSLREVRRSVLTGTFERRRSPKSPAPTRLQFQTDGSMALRVLAVVIILLDAACVGYQVDESLKLGYERHTSDDTSLRAVRLEHWQDIEICFVTYYTLEVAVRCLKERSAFLFGRERFWNLFDSVSVFSSIVCLSLAKDVSSKTLRLIRITKGLRVLRVLRFSESLRAMVVSIMSSLVPLFWALCVMFLVLYFFSVIIATEIADSFERTPASSDSGPDVSVFLPYYKSLPDTTLYLFMSITGGIDWHAMAVPLLDVDPVLMAVFVMYIFLMAFGVVVVGIFVAKAQESAARDRKEGEVLKRMRDIFHEADQNGDNRLSWEEFRTCLADDKVAAFFRTLGLDVNVAQALFIMLDVDDSDAVNMDDFVHGCNRLKGGARSIDVNMLLYQSEKLQHQFLDCMDSLGRDLTRLAKVHDLSPCQVANKKVKASARRARQGLAPLLSSGTPSSMWRCSDRGTPIRVPRHEGTPAVDA